MSSSDLAPPGSAHDPTGPAPSSAAAGAGHDAAIARMLGLFFVVLTVPVVAGLWFAPLPIDRLLNSAAALALAGVGAVFLARARHLARRGG